MKKQTPDTSGAAPLAPPLGPAEGPHLREPKLSNREQELCSSVAGRRLASGMEESFFKSAFPDSSFLLEDSSLALPPEPDRRTPEVGRADRSARVQQQVQLTLARRARRSASHGNIRVLGEASETKQESVPTYSSCRQVVKHKMQRDSTWKRVVTAAENHSD